MRLDETQILIAELTAVEQRIPITAKSPHHFGDAHSVGVSPFEPGRIEQPGESKTRQIRRVKTQTLFIRERDDIDVERQVAPRAINPLNTGDADQNPERSV